MSKPKPFQHGFARLDAAEEALALCARYGTFAEAHRQAQITLNRRSTWMSRSKALTVLDFFRKAEQEAS